MTAKSAFFEFYVFAVILVLQIVDNLVALPSTSSRLLLE